MLPRFVEQWLREWSPRFSPVLFKAILWSLGAGAVVVPLAIVALPFIEFFNDMAAQPKGKALGTYGRTFGEELAVDRLPPEGSLPRGVTPARFPGNDEATAVAAGAALSNPFKRTIASLERGREVFNTFCIACHGSYGLGDGPVVGPERFPAPTSLHDKTIVAYPDGRIYHVISEGKGKMQGYKDKIERADRWHVVNYVRALQRAVSPSEEDLKR